MKTKQVREWCTEKKPKLDHDYKKKHYRCKCGRRVEVIAVIDYWDTVRRKNKKGKEHYVPEIIFKTISDHKTKVEYKQK